MGHTTAPSTQDKFLKLTEEIDALRDKRSYEAPLIEISTWWYLLLPAFIALRMTRTTAEIRAAASTEGPNNIARSARIGCFWFRYRPRADVIFNRSQEHSWTER